MYALSQISSDSLQTLTVVLQDGSSFFMQVYFRPMQYGWFLQSLTYQSFSLSEIRIVNSPNLLHQWRNILPFGLACYSAQNRDPSLQEDFSSGASQLYVLTAEEVAQFAEALSNG